MVVGIVLAAGMSTRMGRPKQLLPLGGRSALAWIVDLLAARLDQVVVVLGHRAEEIAAAVADRCRHRERRGRSGFRAR